MRDCQIYLDQIDYLLTKIKDKKMRNAFKERVERIMKGDKKYIEIDLIAIINNLEDLEED